MSNNFLLTELHRRKSRVHNERHVGHFSGEMRPKCCLLGLIYSDTERCTRKMIFVTQISWGMCSNCRNYARFAGTEKWRKKARVGVINEIRSHVRLRSRHNESTDVFESAAQPNFDHSWFITLVIRLHRGYCSGGRFKLSIRTLVCFGPYIAWTKVGSH